MNRAHEREVRVFSSRIAWHVGCSKGRMRNWLAFALALSTSSALAEKGFDPNDPGSGDGGITIEQACTGPITVKAQKLGTKIGTVAGPVVVHGNSWCSRQFSLGSIHTTEPWGGNTTAVVGSALRAKYTSLGAETGSFGRAWTDPVVGFEGATTSKFSGGYIIQHSTFGVRAIRNPLAALWSGSISYLGYPTADQIATTHGAYSPLEHGYVARTTDMGSWLDYTGAGEGRLGSWVKLYLDDGFSPASSKVERVLPLESPVMLRAQFGALDEKSSSLSVTMPTRASLYLYDESPHDGRFVRITGADASTVRVSRIGSWMNDRPSSMMLVNHGTASSLTSVPGLAEEIDNALGDLDTDALMADALGDDARGWLTWNSPVTVRLIPGERLIEFSVKASMDIDADCVLGVLMCHADGDVRFTIAVRPYVTLTVDPDFGIRPSVHAWFVEGSAVSVSCDGAACGQRDEALATLFQSASVTSTIERAFATAFDAKTQLLQVIKQDCPNLDVRRVNVLPDSLEVVVADTAGDGTCATEFAGTHLDTQRLPATVRNGYAGDPSVIAPAWNGIVTVVPNWEIPPPPMY